MTIYNAVWIGLAICFILAAYVFGSLIKEWRENRGRVQAG